MTTRIRINAEGQLAETRNVNAIKINGQNKTTDQYPNEIIRNADGGGWLIPVYADLPEGAKVTAETWDRPIITPAHYIEVERIVVTPGEVTMVDEIQIVDGEEVTVQVEHREPDIETTVMDSVLVPDLHDYRAYQTVTAYLTAEDQSTQAQMDRRNQLLAMTDAYGADVAILGRLLAVFTDPETGKPFALPCDPSITIQTIKGGLASGAIDFALAPQADAAEGRYRSLREHMSDDDIAAVASMIGGQV